VDPIGVGGFPRAKPYFKWPAENSIRNPRPNCCCDYSTGPNIPAHWYDGGDGWVTNYFTDVESFSWDQKKSGRHRCQVPTGNGSQCDFTVENTSCCDLPCLWLPSSAAPPLMANHLQTFHGINPPPTREWATGLCETTGCCDVYFCLPCQASRQTMAAAGYANTFNVWWCLFFCLAGCHENRDENGKSSLGWVPPYIMAAVLTRCTVSRLNRIDEGLCMNSVKGVFCSCCSLAQTYREYSASGVWPGGTCCNTSPPPVSLKPATIMN